MLTIINNNTNVLHNLALEEYVLKHLNIDEDILLIWQNEESLVVGRNQNPFRDINYPFTLNNKIPVYRRLTIGESVYHDKGLINYSFIVKNSIDNQEDYFYLMTPMIELLEELGIKAVLDDNGDLCVNGSRVTISAQKTYKNKITHHGVLFFDTDIDRFEHIVASPSPNEFEFDKEIIDRKPISNLTNHLEEKISIATFKDLLLKNLIGDNLNGKIYELDYIDKTKTHKIMKEKYDTWEWIYGESPKFIIKREYDNRMMITLIIEQGIIKRVSIDSFENVMDLIQCLEGCKFNEKSLLTSLENSSSVDAEELVRTLMHQ